MGKDLDFEQCSAAFVNIWSMQVDDLLPALLMNTLVGRLTTCARLQAFVTERSFFLKWQFGEK